MSKFAGAASRAGDDWFDGPAATLPAPNVPLRELLRAVEEPRAEPLQACGSMRATSIVDVVFAESRAAGGDVLAGLDKSELLRHVLERHLPASVARLQAKALLSRYGTLGGIVAAPVERLTAQLRSAEAAAFLKLLGALTTEIVREPIADRPLINSQTSLEAYLLAALRHETVECVRLLFLNGANRLIGEEVHSRGTINHCPLYPREVVRRVIEMNANALIIVHNHPSGDPAPSVQDTEMTNLLAQTLERIGVSLHDHMIVGANGSFSFRARGLLQGG